jgi:hypothetical protein
MVTIEANVSGRKIQVWRGSQKQLFSKYRDARTKTMKDIKANLEILRDKLDTVG